MRRTYRLNIPPAAYAGRTYARFTGVNMTLDYNNGMPEPEYKPFVEGDARRRHKQKIYRRLLYAAIGVIIVFVIVMAIIAPDILGGWTMGLLLLAVLAGAYLVRTLPE